MASNNEVFGSGVAKPRLLGSLKLEPTMDSSEETTPTTDQRVTSQRTENDSDEVRLSRKQSSKVRFQLPSKQEEEGGPSGEDSAALDEVVEKPSGVIYTKREYAFVLFAGVIMSFNAGYVNGSCLSGFVAPSGRKQASSSFTIVISQGALALADGDYDRFGFLSGMILSFIFGACLTGIITPDPTPYRIEPTYGPTFLLGATFLVASSILAAFEKNEDWVFFLAAAANGIQNGVSSAYSENLIRSTGFTGPSTDIGIYVSQLCRGDTTNLKRLTVLTSLLSSFWFGGLISFWSAQRLTSFSLLINAGLFVVIGLSLVAFLVYELGISVKSAVLGTWEWKKAINELQTALAESSDYLDRTDEERMGQMFAQMDTQRTGSISARELFVGLKDSGVSVTEKQCELMVKHATKNNSERLSRAQWMKIAQKTSQKLQRDGLRRQGSSRRILFSNFNFSSGRNLGGSSNRTSLTSASAEGSRRLRSLRSLEEEPGDESPPQSP